MATQYTAGIVQGQKWTAAIANQIGAAWEPYTPTITASSGTFTTVTINSARYAQIQKLVFLTIDVTLTSIGTGGGEMRFTVPTGLAAQSAVEVNGVWREVAVTGETGVVQTFTTTVFNMCRYDNAGYLNTGDRYSISCCYEAA